MSSVSTCARRHGLREAYRASWKATGRGGPMPKFGLGRMLVVADTDAEALRWPSAPIRCGRRLSTCSRSMTGCAASAPGAVLRHRGTESGRGFCGSPATVIRQDGGGQHRLFRRQFRVRRPDARGNHALEIEYFRPRGDAGAARLTEVRVGRPHLIWAETLAASPPPSAT